MKRPVIRALAYIQCVSCGGWFQRDWPIPYGLGYVYAGVCNPCKRPGS